MLRSNGYAPPVGAAFVSTGLASVFAGLFGGHALNLSAITAALCAGPEAGPDRSRRWVASVAAGVVYLVLGPFAGFAAAFIAASPPLLIQAVAGLALLTSLAAALATALERERTSGWRRSDLVIAASGVSLLGIGGGLLGARRRRRAAPARAGRRDGAGAALPRPHRRRGGRLTPRARQAIPGVAGGADELGSIPMSASARPDAAEAPHAARMGTRRRRCPPRRRRSGVEERRRCRDAGRQQGLSWS